MQTTRTTLIKVTYLCLLFVLKGNATVIFSDNFENGPSSSWGNEVGNWIVEEGKYYASETSPPFTAWPHAFNLLPFNVENFEFKTKVWNFKDTGIVLRAQNETGSPSLNNAVLLVIGGMAGANNGLYWHIIQEGNPGPVLNPSGYIGEIGEYSPSLRIKVEGDFYQVFLGENQEPITTLTTDLFAMGKVGLFSAYSPGTSFSEVILSVPEPSSLSLLAIGLTGLVMYRQRKKIVGRSTIIFSFLISPLICQAQLSFENGTAWVDVGDSGKGNVGYVFKISKHETTVSQYVNFLNNVAVSSDPYDLFHGFSWRYSEPILRNGSNGNYNYSVAEGFQNRAITGINWLDAARYVNWLHNGGLSSSSTETGVYTLNGITSISSGTTISRSQNAKYFIPTMEEWKKAGFYDSSKNDGSGGWWDLANRSNVGYNEFGGVIPGDSSKMNINQVYFDPARGYVTDVGYFSGQESYYGTFDQSGNVWEWTEGAPSSGTVGGLNGGAWDYFDATAGSTMVGGNRNADFRKDSTGFRIAGVPEPSALSLLAVGLGVILRRSRRKV